MAVYKRTYKPYTGHLTPSWSRFMILPRYSYSRLFQSRFMIIFMMACFFFPLGCAGFIYLSHNLTFLGAFNIRAASFLTIDSQFFLTFCTFQAGMAYLLTAFVGPSLVSPDLVNHALPLYFCRPFSRFEYVIGKMSVLMYLLSLITWVPGLVLFAIQGTLAGRQWTGDNLWIAGAIVTGPLIYITVLSLIAMAMSAWVKWKMAAGALILGVFFAGAGFAGAINSVMRTKSGSLIDLATVNHTIWASLFRVESTSGISVADSIDAMAVACVICLWLLFRKVRAFEVVK
jgi:ABC-2 type transport system permease protein